MPNMFDDASNFVHQSYQSFNEEMPRPGGSGGTRRQSIGLRTGSKSPRCHNRGSVALCAGRGGQPQVHGDESVDVNRNWPADAVQAPSAPCLPKKTHDLRRSNRFSQAIFGASVRLHMMLIIFLALCVQSVQGKWQFKYLQKH